MSFLTLRVRTFLFMLLNIAVAFLLTGIFSLFHFREENKDYHRQRLERKEQAIISHIDYVTKSQQGQMLSEQDWRDALSGRVSEISSIHKLDLGIYSARGNFLAGSLMYTENPDVLPQRLPEREGISSNQPLGSSISQEGNYLIGTQELLGLNNRVELIVRIPYEIDDSTIPDADVEFLRQLFLLYSLLFLIGVLLAFVLSNYISQNMKRVIDQLKKVRINKSNEKLTWRFNDEIGELIQEYNFMVDKLEETAVELAKSERESAWKEMAQQVAHEIKNPLTPMKLTLQLIQREKDMGEVKEMTTYLLEEVESLTNIAEAFSRFAQMPGLQLEQLDISYQTNRAVGLYADRGVSFISSGPVYVNVDKDQWSRIMHNLVKNALQSIPEGTTPEIVVMANKSEEKAVVRVRDNGGGIPAEMADRVFEPNFTTKSSGMGLGLAMVRNLVNNFGGTISFETDVEGTEFRIELPITNKEE